LTASPRVNANNAALEGATLQPTTSAIILLDLRPLAARLRGGGRLVKACRLAAARGEQQSENRNCEFHFFLPFLTQPRLHLLQTCMICPVGIPLGFNFPLQYGQIFILNLRGGPPKG